MTYDLISDDAFTDLLKRGYPTLSERMTANDLRWLWEHYDLSIVDKAMYYLEVEGCTGEPFDEVRRLCARRKHIRTIFSNESKR